MLVFDTNVLIYAADEDSPLHPDCRDRISSAREDPSPAYLSWNICYEFLRVTTHVRATVTPWTPDRAWGFLSTLLASPGFQLLTPTERTQKFSDERSKSYPTYGATSATTFIRPFDA